MIEENILSNSLINASLWCLVCFAFQIVVIYISKPCIPGFDQLKKDIRRTWYNRAVSTAHASIMFLSSIYYWLYINPTMKFSEVNTIHIHQRNTIDIMMGYIMYDTIIEMMSTRQLDTMLHHIFGMISHLSTRFSDSDPAAFYTMIVYLAEGSTPFLNISWIYHQLKLHDTLLYTFFTMSLMASFLITRIIVGPFMLGHFFSNKEAWGVDTDILFYGNSVVLIFFVILNFYWYYKLCKLAFGGKNSINKIDKAMETGLKGVQEDNNKKTE